MGGYDWRLSAKNVWAVEQALIVLPHRAIRTDRVRIERLRDKYRVYLAEHGGRKPIFYDRRRWTPIPPSFTAPAA
jgi:hypothetical protein